MSRDKESVMAEHISDDPEHTYTSIKLIYDVLLSTLRQS
jgi:hypothetical protein